MAGADAQSSKRGTWALKAAGWLALVGLLAAVYVLFTAVSKPADSGLKAYAVGAMKKLEVARDPPPQPLDRFTDESGASRSLADFRGKVVLVNLWATWCAPCVEEMPTLAALQASTSPDAFHVVAISIDRPDVRARAQAELAKLSGGKLAFYHDPSAAIAYKVKVAYGVPISVLYDRGGREIARYSGAADWASPEARALVDAAIARPD
jgi:thiol-disulfide isomerase/thioredoxin